jgi:hypothetical protein
VPGNVLLGLRGVARIFRTWQRVRIRRDKWHTWPDFNAIRRQRRSRHGYAYSEGKQ